MFINFFGEFLCVVCFFFCYKPKGSSGVMFVPVIQDVALCDEKSYEKSLQKIWWNEKNGITLHRF